MGGRGAYAGGDNMQIKMSAYIRRMEVESIRTEMECQREKHDEICDEKMAGGVRGAHGQMMKKRCACCLQYSLPAYSKYEVCPVCGWIDDPRQNSDVTLRQGSNPISLQEARRRWNGKQ